MKIFQVFRALNIQNQKRNTLAFIDYTHWGLLATLAANYTEHKDILRGFGIGLIAAKITYPPNPVEEEWQKIKQETKTENRGIYTKCISGKSEAYYGEKFSGNFTGEADGNTWKCG